MTFYRQWWCFALVFFPTAVPDELSCLWRMYIIQLEMEGAEKKSHQNWLLFVCFAFYQMTHTHHDWMAVFVAFSIQCSEINGKNDIFKCFHRHFALAVVSFSLIFLTFCDASGFVFVLRAPSIIHIGKAFFSAGPHFPSSEVIDRAIDNSTIQPFT